MMLLTSLTLAILFAQGTCRPNLVNNAKDCECVPFYLCVNGTIVTNGMPVINIRSQGECDDYLEVCCKVPQSQQSKPPPVDRQGGCGRRNEDGTGFRIMGDEENEAQFGEFPWMVAILIEEIKNGTKVKSYFCGGSLIHKNVVLTAAHCVDKKDPGLLTLRAGEWDSQTQNELLPHQDRPVAKVIFHERYQPVNVYLKYDIALLITDVPFEYAENVDVACLPQQDEVILRQDCFTSGWGKDIFGAKGKYQGILKKVEVPMVQRDNCLNRLRMAGLGPGFKLHKSFICAGGELGKDACTGDGGSPLVCPIPGRKDHYQQVGIVAWGIGCGKPIPAAYVNVAIFRKWIDTHMARLKYTPEY